MNPEKPETHSKVVSQTGSPELIVSGNQVHDVVLSKSLVTDPKADASPIVKSEKLRSYKKSRQTSLIFYFKLTSLACGTMPPMLIDLGIDPVHCMAICLLASLVLPVTIARTISKASIWQSLQVLIVSMIGCTVTCSLLLSILTAGDMHGPPLHGLLHTFHIPVTALIVLTIWIPASLFEWLLNALWSANVVGLIRDD